MKSNLELHIAKHSTKVTSVHNVNIIEGASVQFQIWIFNFWPYGQLRRVNEIQMQLRKAFDPIVLLFDREGCLAQYAFLFSNSTDFVCCTIIQTFKVTFSAHVGF